MTTTADLVLEHVRRHGRIADLDALAREAGRSAEAVLRSLKGLLERGAVQYLLWDGPIRVMGSPFAPSNEGAKSDTRSSTDALVDWAIAVLARPRSAPEGEPRFAVVGAARGAVISTHAHVEDATAAQRTRGGRGVLRISDGRWISRLVRAGWGQPAADRDEDEDREEETDHA